MSLEIEYRRVLVSKPRAILISFHARATDLSMERRMFCSGKFIQLLSPQTFSICLPKHCTKNRNAAPYHQSFQPQLKIIRDVNNPPNLIAAMTNAFQWPKLPTKAGDEIKNDKKKEQKQIVSHVQKEDLQRSPRARRYCERRN